MHFKEMHKTIVDVKSHISFLCRICMTHEKFDTLEKLLLHLDHQHKDLRHPDNLGSEMHIIEDDSVSVSNKNESLDALKMPDCVLDVNVQ